MKKTILFLLIAFTSLASLAQAPTHYYDDATGKTGDELRSALHEIVKDHTTISYQQIWNAFWSTDNKGNGVVWDMYSDGAGYTYSYANGNQQCGSYEQEGDCYNREHSWPKSWFSGNEQTTPGRDLHHIFPTDGFVNAQRSSYPFGEVSNASWTSQNGSKLGTCKSTLGYTGTVFEPIDEYKGDFARAIMYMSVRYYGEDDDWGTSGMTNKSDIKPWAIQMLMNWSDNDPVSAKEIARNNVIYNDYQHNRNPFIDHPEYARAIWDPDWHGVEYNVSYSTVQHGSISGPSKAVEGTMVTLTATPAEGYMIGSWNVYKTGEPGNTVSVNGDGSFTMPAFNVTVSANFVENSTYYTITCANVQHGSISASVNSAQSGRSITLNASPSTGYSLYSWYVYKTGDMNTMVFHGTSNTFTMPAFDVTVRATFVQGTVGDNYVKVTSAPSNWSGDYLIVYEDGGKAFNGGSTDLGASNNNISVSINSQAIASTAATDAARFTIANSGDNYTVKSASGYYIGQTSNNNGLVSSQTQAYTNTISYNTSESSINIVGSGGAYLRFNNGTSEQRFRYYKSSTYTGQQPIQLYKKTTGTVSVPTHTIHFNSNGGNGTMNDQTVNEFESTQLNAIVFLYPGYEFMGWNTQADGLGQYYTDGATVSLLDDLTLYAQWKQIFNITLTSPQNGSVTISQTQALEGDLIVLTATPATGYEFDHWSVTDAANHPISVVDNQFEMPASNVTVSATFAQVGVFAQQYHLVTSVDQLVAGRTYLIVNTAAGKALSTTQNNKNRSGVAVTISNNVISSIGSTVCELTLGGSTGAWTFFDAYWSDNGGYLYASSSSNNYLQTQASNNYNGIWSIEIASNGTATVVAQGSNTRNNLRYNPNSGNPIFSCYASTSTMAKVELYIRSEEYTYNTSETIANLYPFDKHTVSSDATLSVTGTASCDDASHLILEDGAQLIHHTDGVKATVKKSITGYYGNSGWYTIATPFTNYTPTEIVTDSYDLFTYHEAGPQEWLNYKISGFSMAPGTGYLYAHNPSTTLRMTGTLNSGTYSKTVSLSFENPNESIKGFNLLGNPTVHDISYSTTPAVSNGYYYLDNHDTWVYTTSSTVPAGRGFLVKANAASQSVTLNPQSKGDSDEKEPYIVVNIDGEQAYLKMSDGVSMPLLSFMGKSSSLWLKRQGQPYIMLVRDDDDNIELNYKAPQPGWHQISVSADNVDTEYLHLIDRLTGDDIDLLSTPNYSFESHSSDYTERFQLVFSPNAYEEEDVFAYYADGRIVISNISEPYQMEVIDITGRIVNTLTPGIYVVRLTTPDRVRTQKIIIN